MNGVEAVRRGTWMGSLPFGTAGGEVLRNVTALTGHSGVDSSRAPRDLQTYHLPAHQHTPALETKRVSGSAI